MTAKTQTKNYTQAELDALKAEMRRLDETWKRLRIGYTNSVDGITETELRTAVWAYIEASYAWQRARYGKIQVKMNVAGLLR